jgi:hypothetical protein
VEQATGRKVRVFLSETNVDLDVSVETFLLADQRTDMTDFERRLIRARGEALRPAARDHAAAASGGRARRFG